MHSNTLYFEIPLTSWRLQGYSVLTSTKNRHRFVNIDRSDYAHLAITNPQEFTMSSQFDIISLEKLFVEIFPWGRITFCRQFHNIIDRGTDSISLLLIYSSIQIYCSINWLHKRMSNNSTEVWLCRTLDELHKSKRWCTLKTALLLQKIAWRYHAV